MFRIIKTEKVKLYETDGEIRLAPIKESEDCTIGLRGLFANYPEMSEGKLSCPFLGIGVDSNLTLDKFLEWKREEREAEYEKDLRS